jgi:hypothetical protein
MPLKELTMFLPVIVERLKKEKEAVIEKRLELPNYQQQYEEYIKSKEEEKSPERVIHIQIY